MFAAHHSLGVLSDMVESSANSIARASTLAFGFLYGISLLGACATEIQETNESQAPLGPDAASTAGSAGAMNGGSEAGGSPGSAGGAGSGGMAQTAGVAGTPLGGTPSGGAGGAGVAGSAGAGPLGGGGVGGAGGAGGNGGSGGKAGSGGMAGAGGAAPNPCAKTKLVIKAATASSTENDTFPVSQAFDGKADTRWASAQSAPQWIYFDLGQVAHVSRVLINWETAFATNYRVEIASAAAGPWTSIFSETNGNGAMDDITNLTPSNGRYVRMYGNTRATAYGFSLWEFEVYGDLDEKCQ
jgi:hypothetical protein